jgi:hypothetical protein
VHKVEEQLDWLLPPPNRHRFTTDNSRQARQAVARRGATGCPGKGWPAEG